MIDTAIATLASQTSFTIIDGSTSDDAYNGTRVVVTSDGTLHEKAEGRISDYTGATKTVTLDADPGIFTMAVGDWIVVHSDAAFDATTVSTLIDQIWDETQASHVAAGSMGVVASEVAEIMAGTTTLSTDVDDLITEATAHTTMLQLLTSATTTLSTDIDDLISSTTLIHAESTASAAVIDNLATEATAHTTQLQLLTSATTTLSTDIDDLISSTTLIHAESTASAAVIDGIAAGTTALSTDIADIWQTAITELSSAMSATPTVLDILAFQHMAGWNQRVTTGTSGYDIIYTDAGSTMFLANITEPTTASFQRAQWTT